MSSTYTKVIYQSELIYVDTNENYMSIKTNSDIKAGELLLIEHEFANTHDICTLVIQENEYLYNDLYPRLSKWKKEDNREDATIKLIKNQFSEGGEMMIFGTTISKINHLCTSNCVIFLCSRITPFNITINYAVLYSTKNISKGDELTIMYNYQSGHNNEDDFVCDCNKSIDDRQKIWDIIKNIGASFQKINNDELQNIFTKYEESHEAKRIMILQYLVGHGYVINNDDNVYIDSKFTDFFNKHYTLSDDNVVNIIPKFTEFSIDNCQIRKRDVKDIQLLGYIKKMIFEK